MTPGKESRCSRRVPQIAMATKRRPRPSNKNYKASAPPTATKAEDIASSGAAAPAENVIRILEREAFL